MKTITQMKRENEITEVPKVQTNIELHLYQLVNIQYSHLDDLARQYNLA